MVTHVELDILEFEVKWVFGSITTNKAQLKFQLSYLKSEKMILLKCCTQYVNKFGKLNSGHRPGKSQFFSSAEECSNYCTVPLISHASKAMLKILKARLQQYVNPELPDVQVGFRKGREEQRYTHLNA